MKEISVKDDPKSMHSIRLSAKAIQKVKPVKFVDALDMAAQDQGFHDFKDYLQKHFKNED